MHRNRNKQTNKSMGWEISWRIYCYWSMKCKLGEKWGWGSWDAVLNMLKVLDLILNAMGSHCRVFSRKASCLAHFGYISRWWVVGSSIPIFYIGELWLRKCLAQDYPLCQRRNRATISTQIHQNLSTTKQPLKVTEANDCIEFLLKNTVTLTLIFESENSFKA